MKTEVKRAVIRDRAKERELLSKCTVSESGMIIYPGSAREDARTGSPITQLIDWYLYRTGKEKPLDYEIFEDFIEGRL